MIQNISVTFIMPTGNVYLAGSYFFLFYLNKQKKNGTKVGLCNPFDLVNISTRHSIILNQNTSE